MMSRCGERRASIHCPELGNLLPAWPFDVACIRIFVTQIRTQHRVNETQILRQTVYLASFLCL